MKINNRNIYTKDVIDYTVLDAARAIRMDQKPVVDKTMTPQVKANIKHMMLKQEKPFYLKYAPYLLALADAACVMILGDKLLTNADWFQVILVVGVIPLGLDVAAGAAAKMWSNAELAPSKKVKKAKQVIAIVLMATTLLAYAGYINLDYESAQADRYTAQLLWLHEAQDAQEKGIDTSEMETNGGAENGSTEFLLLILPVITSVLSFAATVDPDIVTNRLRALEGARMYLAEEHDLRQTLNQSMKEGLERFDDTAYDEEMLRVTLERLQLADREVQLELAGELSQYFDAATVEKLLNAQPLELETELDKLLTVHTAVPRSAVEEEEKLPKAVNFPAQ